MLKLLFHVGDESFVVNYDSIEEIIPKIPLIPLSRMPEHIPGYFIYHGKPVIVVDSCLLLLNRPTTSFMHSRIIIFQHAFANDGAAVQRIGLIAERVTGFNESEEGDFVDCGYQLRRLPFIGKVFSDHSGSLQQFRVEEFFLYFEDYLFLSAETRKIDKTGGCLGQDRF